MKKLFTLIAVAMMAFAAQANVLTVCDGTDWSGQLPIYGYYVDAAGTMGQMIYPADMLTDMKGSTITEVKFYAETTIKFYDGKLELSLKEVATDHYETETAITDATVVGSVVPEEGSTELVFVLDEPYEYTGGNLMVEVKVAEEGEYGGTYFVGTNVNYQSSFVTYSWWWTVTDTYSFLPKVTFTYDDGVPPTPPTPGEMTAAPTFNGYTTDGIHAYFVEIVETEPSTIYYRVQFPDGEWTDWAEYDEILSFTGNGKYRVEAYAVAPGKAASYEIAYEFVVSPFTGIAEMNADKAVASVRYYNMAGQEMQEANGMTIVVTTYTDGTSSSVKVMK